MFDMSFVYMKHLSSDCTDFDITYYTETYTTFILNHVDILA